MIAKAEPLPCVFFAFLVLLALFLLLAEPQPATSDAPMRGTVHLCTGEVFAGAEVAISGEPPGVWVSGGAGSGAYHLFVSQGCFWVEVER